MDFIIGRSGGIGLIEITAEPERAEDFLRQAEEWEREEEEREQLHFKELRKYVDSLSKVELQEQLYNALVELEDKRNSYW